MNLNDVNRGITKHKKRMRIGRGKGSGKGKTSGRGHKGQGQLAGWSASPIFEGGKMPLIRRIPKRGFNNRWAYSVAIINLGDFNEAYKSGEAVTPDSLRERHLVRGDYDLLKVLGNGELTKKLKISAHRFSKSAREKIEKAGGEAIVLPRLAPATEKASKD